MKLDEDFAGRLIVLAGEIMEDVSPMAIIDGNITERIAAVRTASEDIVLLANAAEALNRRARR